MFIGCWLVTGCGGRPLPVDTGLGAAQVLRGGTILLACDPGMFVWDEGVAGRTVLTGTGGGVTDS